MKQEFLAQGIDSNFSNKIFNPSVPSKSPEQAIREQKPKQQQRHPSSLAWYSWCLSFLALPALLLWSCYLVGKPSLLGPWRGRGGGKGHGQKNIPGEKISPLIKALSNVDSKSPLKCLLCPIRALHRIQVENNIHKQSETGKVCEQGVGDEDRWDWICDRLGIRYCIGRAYPGWGK